MLLKFSWRTPAAFKVFLCTGLFRYNLLIICSSPWLKPVWQQSYQISLLSSSSFLQGKVGEEGGVTVSIALWEGRRWESIYIVWIVRRSKRKSYLSVLEHLLSVKENQDVLHTLMHNHVLITSLIIILTYSSSMIFIFRGFKKILFTQKCLLINMWSTECIVF